MPKSSKAVVEQRVNEVLSLRIRGWSLDRIVNYSVQEKWNVTRIAVYNYLLKADQKLTEIRERDRERIVARHIAKRQFIYEQAVDCGDWSNAMNALKDEAKIEGIYQPEPVQQLPHESLSPVITVHQTVIHEQHNTANHLDFDALRREYRQALTAPEEVECQPENTASGNGDVPEGRSSLD